MLSLQRMRTLREIDLASNTMTVEAGMVLANAQAEADRAGRLFPLSLASEGSCTIGGNLATNAGGTGVIAYGSARDLVLGVEAVLADGRIYAGLSKLKKDNTGYDLKHLFIGSEGHARNHHGGRPEAVSQAPRGRDRLHRARFSKRRRRAARTRAATGRAA